MPSLDHRPSRLESRECDPKHYNSLPDYVANVALDLQQDWSCLTRKLLDAPNAETMIVDFSVDGAISGDGSSAGGLAILTFLESGQEVLLSRAGCKFEVLRLPFWEQSFGLWNWAWNLFTNLIR